MTILYIKLIQANVLNKLRTKLSRYTLKVSENTVWAARIAIRHKDIHNHAKNFIDLDTLRLKEPRSRFTNNHIHRTDFVSVLILIDHWEFSIKSIKALHSCPIFLTILRNVTIQEKKTYRNIIVPITIARDRRVVSSSDVTRVGRVTATWYVCRVFLYPVLDLRYRTALLIFLYIWDLAEVLIVWSIGWPLYNTFLIVAHIIFHHYSDI